MRSMLFRGLLAATVLAAGVILSTRIVFEANAPVAPGAGVVSGKSADDGGRAALVPAPISIGAPASAAFQIQRPGVPDETPILVPDYRHTVRLGRGGTLTRSLVKAGVSRDQAHAAATALKSVYDPRRLQPEQEITITFRPDLRGVGPGLFLSFSVMPDYDRQITVARTPEGGFMASEKAVVLKRTLAGASGTIRRNLFLDGGKAGVPVKILIDLIRAYSWDVDFQRDIQPGDAFKVMYERMMDENGNPVQTGQLIFASLTLSGVTYPVYLHKPANGRPEYFNDKGHSAQKALMRTPIDGARLSSGYGRRKHPILGYTKMHQGADFSAPRGTPIYAAGNGTVDEAGRNGAYGKYVRLRHNAEYSSAYAHMSRIAKGMRKGRRVTQGQIIGYVGSTGRSTGAHLHYEIIKKGRRTNPMKVRMPSGRILKGQALDLFHAARVEIDKAYAALDIESSVASSK